MNRCLALLLTLVIAAITAQPAAASRHHHHRRHPPTAGFDLKRPEIVDFVTDVVARDSFKRKAVLALLAKAEPQPKIIELMTRPAEKVTPWWEYREHFLTEERVAMGAQFWADHRQALEKISAERGIAPEYLVAVIGVETRYGRTTGKFRVLDALATLAFD